MKGTLIVFACLSVIAAYAQEEDAVQAEAQSESAAAAPVAEPQELSETGIVMSILEKNGVTGVSFSDIATFGEGRIVGLNLNNPEAGRPGIKILPPEIGRLDALKILSLNDNDLVTLPDEIGRLKALERLEARNNSLVALPSTIGNLSNLEELDVRNNELTSLPIEIGLCSKLWKLQLWGNALRTLPESIGGLSSLRELYLRGNRLTTMPRSVLKLKLGYLDMQENRLCDVSSEIDLWLKKFDAKYRSWQKCW